MGFMAYLQQALVAEVIIPMGGDDHTRRRKDDF
jgi:hypothetical protein